jgi:hypothetical protein
MKSNNRWQKVSPIKFRNICWPVKIRVRAETPQMAPRTPPVFPVSLFLAADKVISGHPAESSPSRRGVRMECPKPSALRLSRKVELYDWRVMGEQDERWEY